jgi:hypothetical protein
VADECIERTDSHRLPAPSTVKNKSQSTPLALCSRAERSHHIRTRGARRAIRHRKLDALGAEAGEDGRAPLAKQAQRDAEHTSSRRRCMGQEMRAESTAREPDARGEAAAAKRGERRCCGISPPAGSEQTSRLRRAGPGTQPLCILPVPCRLLLLLPLALAQFFVVFVVPPVKIGSHGWPRWGPMDEPYIWGPNVGVPTVA